MLYMQLHIQLGGNALQIILINGSDIPIYQQIKVQVKEQIFSGGLVAGEMLPSLRQLAKDLKISVLTTTRAYKELEEEGFIASQHGKGFFILSSSSGLLREQLIREVEMNLNAAIQVAQKASLSDDELFELLRLLVEVERNND